jgi:CHRD domain
MRRTLIATAVAVPAMFVGIVATAQGGGTTAQNAAATPGTLTICHKTPSLSNPWRRITVSARAMNNPRTRNGRLLRAHLRHTGDAVVVGSGPCPAGEATPAPTNTPATRITICHKTGSSANPYRRITVSSRAISSARSTQGRLLRGHMTHAGDVLLPGANICPTGTREQPTRLTATLQPVAGATGSGSATFNIRLGRSELCYTLTVTGLSSVEAAHIHRTETRAIAVTLSPPTSGSSSGCMTVDKELLQEIVSRPASFYVNVHTLTHPDGQVQGRLSR